MAVMRTPGSAPTAVQEFCGKGVKEGSAASDQGGDVRAAGFDSVVCRRANPMIIADAQKAAELAGGAEGCGGTGSAGGVGVSTEQW